MEINRGKLHTLISTLVLIASIALLSPPVWPDTLEQQRKLYLSAKKALRDGQLTAYKKTSTSLKDYPLYPYLVV